MTATRDSTVAARIPADLRAALDTLAASDGVELSTVVRAALREYADRHDNRRTTLGPGRLLIPAANAIHAAPTDNGHVLPRTTTVADARREVYERLPDGTDCPVCGQYARQYRRKIHRTMARELIGFYRAAGVGWAHLPTVLASRGGDFAKLRYWALIEEHPGVDSVGYWRVTEAGADFLYGRRLVARYALVYNGELRGFDGPGITISDALGQPFDLAELMAAAA